MFDFVSLFGIKIEESHFLWIAGDLKSEFHQDNQVSSIDSFFSIRY